jgi:hypothetical protein
MGLHSEFPFDSALFVVRDRHVEFDFIRSSRTRLKVVALKLEMRCEAHSVLLILSLERVFIRL